MFTENPKNPDLFINEIAPGIRGNILKMDQKLRGLRAEIDARLNNSLLQSQDESIDPNRLSIVAQEIDHALSSINTLVNLVNTQDEDDKNSLLNSDEMRQFAAMLDDNLEKITKIKNEF